MQVAVLAVHILEVLHQDLVVSAAVVMAQELLLPLKTVLQTPVVVELVVVAVV
jgi:hypothetical protein